MTAQRSGKSESSPVKAPREESESVFQELFNLKFLVYCFTVYMIVWLANAVYQQKPTQFANFPLFNSGTVNLTNLFGSVESAT